MQPSAKEQKMQLNYTCKIQNEQKWAYTYIHTYIHTYTESLGNHVQTYKMVVKF